MMLVNVSRAENKRGNENKRGTEKETKRTGGSSKEKIEIEEERCDRSSTERSSHLIHPTLPGGQR